MNEQASQITTGSKLFFDHENADCELEALKQLNDQL